MQKTQLWDLDVRSRYAKALADTQAQGYRLAGEYAGPLLDGKPHGLGLLVLSGNSFYFGNFHHGSFHGKGTLAE